MLDHEKVFTVAKNDAEFQKALKLTKQKFPSGWFLDTIQKGIWASGYAGWVLGRYGEREYMKRMDEWRLL